ncbi:autotransporter outer membrane beta-barrel domain-containing protein [Desulfovibrio sp. SGI.133]|uniref:autotransporter outer membrane beta-barrel domain-containing protein n=1 Tax=Desulfovibrio sp. SGI.133 TaxID=3420560 RepID=UPI003D018DDC
MSALPFLHSRHFSPRLSLACLVFLLLLPACPAPGSDLDGTAHNHHAQIRTGDSYSNVYGVMSYGDSARARYGTVVSDGGQAVQTFGGWCYGGVADTAYNSIVVNGGRISDNAYGGSALATLFARSNSNTVVQTGGTVSHIVGGNADSGRDKALADSNLVIIKGGTTGTVVGGHASGLLDGSSRYNLVSISGGSVTSIAGGSATATTGIADASFNAVLVSGGSIRDHIIGGIVHTSSSGQGYTAHYNAITLTGGSIGGDVYGSALTDPRGTTYTPLPAAGSGNSLNLLGWQGTLHRVAAFQYLNLALPNGMRSGDTLLTLGSGQTAGDLQGGTVSVLGALGGQGMRIGDRYTLVHGTGTGDLALRDGGTVHDAPKGFALLFDGSMQRNGDSIDLTITGLRANPQIKAFNQYRVAQMAALDRGARLVEGTALEQARKAADGQDAWMPFAAIHGGTERYGNDGWADGTGLELAAGLARSFTGEAGDLLLGAFFEYGQASIGTREDFSVGDVYGTGSARYAGGGLVARFDLTSGLLSGLYAQAGLRLGQINGDWQSQDIASVLQQTADFDTSTAYYGLFAGLGYQWQATERLRLDSRASFFWNHQDGQDISIMGEEFRFDPMDSCLLRVGTRLSYEVFQGFSPYAGVAWEHEFDGTARTELNNHGVDAPSVSMRGDSAVFMAGLQWDPGNSSLHVDLGLEGSAGIRQSIGGQARLVWEF